MNRDGHVLNAAFLALGLGIVLSVDLQGGVTVERPIDAATRTVSLTLPVVLGALFPDVDTAFGKHRKTLHNLPVLAAFVAWPLVFGNLQFVWIGVATHYVLDVVGSRRGIALFYPLSSSEYGFPTGVTTDSRFATPVTVVVSVLEVAVLAGLHFYVLRLDAGGQLTVNALGL